MQIKSLSLLGAGVFATKIAIVVLILVPKSHAWTQWVGAGFALAATMCFATVLERLVKESK